MNGLPDKYLNFDGELEARGKLIWKKQEESFGERGSYGFGRFCKMVRIVVN